MVIKEKSRLRRTARLNRCESLEFVSSLVLSLSIKIFLNADWLIRVTWGLMFNADWLLGKLPS